MTTYICILSSDEVDGISFTSKCRKKQNNLISFFKMQNNDIFMQPSPNHVGGDATLHSIGLK